MDKDQPILASAQHDEENPKPEADTAVGNGELHHGELHHGEVHRGEADLGEADRGEVDLGSEGYRTQGDDLSNVNNSPVGKIATIQPEDKGKLFEVKITETGEIKL